MPHVRFKTTLGDIVVEIDSGRAPITADSFLSYVNDGFYAGTIVHRVEPDFVIQLGGYTADLQAKKTKPPIKNEWQNGLKNKRGTLSMARTQDPDSATSQFFINLKDNDPLDQAISGGAGYAVFGKVVEGMDVVDKIAAGPARKEPKLGGMPCPNPRITVQSAAVEEG